MVGKQYVIGNQASQSIVAACKEYFMEVRAVFPGTSFLFFFHRCNCYSCQNLTSKIEVYGGLMDYSITYSLLGAWSPSTVKQPIIILWYFSPVTSISAVFLLSTKIELN